MEPTKSRYDIPPSASVLMHEIASAKSNIERFTVELNHHNEEAKRRKNMIDELNKCIADYEAALKKLQG